MVTITIDGKRYQAEENETILQAAVRHGIEIPYFCWHPKLSVSGNCRMCLVEVEKMPKLVIACMTRVAEGMVVETRNERVITARQAVMEFLLINHPLDCPICDEAGECKLQDYAYTYSRGASRFDENKVHKPKRVPLGPRVMLDVERCIMCSRCIRFSEEIAKQPVLTFTQRGDHVVLTTFPDKELDNPYSMNVIDICPVGALTSRDFRFRSRVWEMASTESVCVGCARGCNTYLWTRNNQAMRLTPRINNEVNEHWLCDHGRLSTYKFINEDIRVQEPLIRQEGKPIEVEWDEAIRTAARRLRDFKPKEIAVVASPYSTNEENYLLRKFAQNILKTPNIDYIENVREEDEDEILIRADKTPNSAGLKLLGFRERRDGSDWEGILRGIREGKIRCLYIMNEDLGKLDEVRELLPKLDLIVVHAWSHNSTTEAADIVFSSSTYAEIEGTITNFEGRVQMLRPAIITKGRFRSLEHMKSSRWDKFGTQYDKWERGPRRNARPAWEVLRDLANAMGAKFRYRSAEDVFAEIAGSVAPFKGLTYERLGRSGAAVSMQTGAGVKIS